LMKKGVRHQLSEGGGGKMRKREPKSIMLGKKSWLGVRLRTRKKKEGKVWTGEESAVEKEGDADICVEKKGEWHGCAKRD